MSVDEGEVPQGAIKKVRYKLVRDIASVYITPSVTDWNSYVDMLRRNGITVREKIGKSGRVNLYYGVGKHEFWYKKLDPFLSRENLELKFKARRLQSQPKPNQPESIVIPPLPDVVCGTKIDQLGSS